MSRGLLIAFEGADGSGKTTLVAAVSKEIHQRGEGWPHRTSEPRNKQGVREQLAAGESPLHVYESDRRQHWAQRISPILCSGVIVLTDRYYLSTAIYQATDSMTWQAIYNRQRARFAKPDLWVICIADETEARLEVREPPEPYSVEVERRYEVARHALGAAAITVDCSDACDLQHNATRVAWEILRLRT